MIAETPLVLAHAGHWLVSMIYAAPALLLAGALGVSTFRQRRRGDVADSEEARTSDECEDEPSHDVD